MHEILKNETSAKANRLKPHSWSQRGGGAVCGEAESLLDFSGVFEGVINISQGVWLGPEMCTVGDQ